MVGLDVILREAEKVSEEEAWRRLELLYKSRKIDRIYWRAHKLVYHRNEYFAPRIDDYLIRSCERFLYQGYSLSNRNISNVLTVAVFEYYKRNPEYKKTVDFILDKIHPEAREAILKIWDDLGEKVYNMFSEFFGRDVGELDAFKDYADYVMNESLKWIEMHFRDGLDKLRGIRGENSLVDAETTYKMATNMIKRDLNPIEGGFALNALYNNGGDYANPFIKEYYNRKSGIASEKIEEFAKWIAEVSKVYMTKVDDELGKTRRFTF